MNYAALKEKYKLNNVQLAHFLGQLDHESAGFKFKYENLMYSAKGLQEVFKKYFPNAVIAGQYQRKPEAIANRVYANRMGNGDEKSGDGWRFRGRGFIQLTGRDNYTAFSKYIGENCVANPDLVAEKYPFEAAYWYFKNNGIFQLCTDLSEATIQKVTRKINGGLNGLADRKTKTLKHYNAIK